MKWAMRGAAASVLAAMTMLAGSVIAQDRTTLASEREKFSYAVGMDFGGRIKPVVPFMDMAAFEAALKQAFAGGQAPLTESEARAVDETLRANLAAADGQPLPGQPPGSAPAAVDKAKVGQLMGFFVVGQPLGQFKEQVDTGVLAQAVRQTAAGSTLMTPQQAQEVLTSTLQKLQAQQGQRNREEGNAFLASNKAVKGVISTPSGLQYMVLRAGNGARPTPSSRVRVNYEGKLLNGKVFDSSYARGEPAEFGLNQVIPGWTEGVSLMPTGSKYRFWIPSDLAYGPAGSQNGPVAIGPDSTLVFDVELMGIVQ